MQIVQFVFILLITIPLVIYLFKINQKERFEVSIVVTIVAKYIIYAFEILVLDPNKPEAEGGNIT